MTHIKVKIDHAVAEAELTGVLTSRMVGVPVCFEFGPIWDGLIKAAVFQGSGASITVMLFRTNEVELPFEVLMSAGSTLKIGVEGRSHEGGIVIPSTMVEVGRILEGADPHGTPPGEATEPVWGQIMAKVDALEARTEELVDAEDLETAIESHKNDPNDHPELRDTIRSVSDECMQNHIECIRSVNGVGPDKDGNVEVSSSDPVVIVDDLVTVDSTMALSARMGAVLREKIDDDVLTLQNDTAAKLAKRVQTVNGVKPDANGNVEVGAPVTVDSELSATSENPVQNKVIFGMVFEFSETLQLLQADIPTDAHINDLIDAKLGVIENGAY